ncbi:uncharacterized protein LOC126908041 isoform X2 [Daktulosphaira vitifoliae]|uniref:uncharacterized protein LOC126908041 isoform X2 n=1 Tax=Daktulosphaira vitifoliae TaxID=58002 RepID=UPI0021A9BACE|nr:uncharacterized protein LOC126908041 isoform X2 [Daktulosphaira vitifoliae]
MDDLDTAIFVYSAIRVLRKKKRVNRKWWVHPINSERLLNGAFYNLYNLLRADNAKFFNYFRMSPSTFDELFNNIKTNIMRQDTVMRSAIPAEEMLAVTLRYLSSTNSLQDLHYEFRIGRSTLCGIIRIVCLKIWEVMHDECIPTPNEEKWLEIAEGYQQRAQFPHCIGAIDGKHIEVIKPREPNLINGIQIPIPYAFVGDEAFGLSTNLLRPYSGKCLPVNKRIFNYRLSRARRHVECAFGILSNKWRIFHRPIDVDVELAIDIVKCCCVLHNFVRTRDGYNFEDSLTVTGMQDIELDNNFNVNRSINRYRDALANYFSSELGQVPWQMEKI